MIAILRCDSDESDVEVSAALDVGGGVKHASFSDPDGNTFTLQELACRYTLRPVNDATEQTDEVSLILVVSEATAARLPAVLAVQSGEATGTAMPITVVCAPSVRDQTDAAVLAYGAGLVLVAASDTKTALAEATLEHVSALTSRHVCVTTLPESSEISDLAEQIRVEQIRVERARVAGLDFASDLPLLLWTDTCPREFVTAYLSRALASTGPGPMADFLAGLTLRASDLFLESVDPRDDAIEASTWVDARMRPGSPAPPWRLRYVLYADQGEEILSDPVPYSPRVERNGGVRPENLVARIPLSQSRTKDYRLALEVVTDEPALAFRRDVQPRRGALFGGRTVRLPVKLPVTDEKPPDLRYLVHTTGHARHTQLTILRGSGKKAERTWARMMLAEDLRYIFRGEAGRRTRLQRLALLLTAPFFRGREIWLIGERADTAQDNGLHLFRHLRETAPERGAYYVMDKKSPHYERVRPLGHVIEHSSLRHRIYMLHATVLANAYTIQHMLPRQWSATNYARHVAWRVGTLRVYLKHGVHLSPDAVKRGTAGYDMFLTVSADETAALRAVSGYDDQLTEVGLPRYDALTPTPPTRTLLFMSTWRRYLVPTLFGGENADLTAFEGSAYEQFFTGLLRSQRLQELLERHDYRLTFLPHYNMASYFEDATTAGDRVTLADTDESSFADLIRGCDGFLTDHSSVHFDVAYLGTPIIYARFDQQDFEARHASPSWFDYERDGFGPVTHSLEETLDALTRLLESGCAQDQEYRDRIDAAFTFRDQKNCARTVAAIDDRLSRERDPMTRVTA